MRPVHLLSLALALAALSLTAAPAGATVTITPRQIVVTAPGGARAVASRTPFGLSFADASGRTVLEEVAATGTPTVVPPAPQSEFATIGAPPPALYAPLGFLVGSQSVAQTP